jgi:DNA primase
VTLVEGESDTQTLWHHDEPALGIPGAGTWKEEWASLLDGIERIYVVVEPDQAGETLRKSVAESRIRDRVHFVTLPRGAKDPSELHLLNPERFRKRWDSALESATPWVEAREVELEAEHAAAWERCKELARDPDILERFASELTERGIVGEQRTAKLIYLAVTSRLLDRPVSVAVKGPSSAGKSIVVERTLGSSQRELTTR